MQNFKNIQVWQKSHQLVLEIYKLTTTFPADEKFGLTSQMRRSASSIPTNIAEGTGRGSDADFARFLQISLGSTCELEYQLILGRDLNFITQESYHFFESEITSIKKMLGAFIRKLKANRAEPSVGLCAISDCAFKRSDYDS